MASYDETPMTTGGWFLTLLVLAVPLLNVIMYVIWACGAGNRSRVTFCRATILWALIGAVLYVLLVALGLGTVLLTELNPA